MAISITSLWRRKAQQDKVDEAISLAELYIALYEGNLQQLKFAGSRFGFASRKNHTGYVHMPVGRTIVRVTSNLIAANPFDISSDENKEQYEQLALSSGLRNKFLPALRKSMISGRSALRWQVDPTTMQPVVTVVPDSDIVDYSEDLYGQLLSITIETRIYKDNKVYRLIETLVPGMTACSLYVGSDISLGDQIPLTYLPETADRQDREESGIDIVPARIMYFNHDESPGGWSIFGDMYSQLLAINETYTLSQEQMRASAPMIEIPESYNASKGGTLTPGVNIFWRDDTDGDADSEIPKIEVTQANFDAQANEAWLNLQVDLALTMAGVSPAQLSRNRNGGAASGTALRLQMIDAITEAMTSVYYLQHELSQHLLIGAKISQAINAESWVGDIVAPVVQLHPDIPRDSYEEAQEAQLWEAVGALTTEDKVERSNPGLPPKAKEEKVKELEQQQLDNSGM